MQQNADSFARKNFFQHSVWLQVVLHTPADKWLMFERRLDDLEVT